MFNLVTVVHTCKSDFTLYTPNK